MAKERGPNDLDSKVSERSGIYFFPGRVSTYDEVVARGDIRDSILISIMSSNGFDRVQAWTGALRARALQARPVTPPPHTQRVRSTPLL